MASNTLKRVLFVFIPLLIITTATALAEPVVIVNVENKISTLSREEIIDLFMGRYNNFPDGHHAQPCNQVDNMKLTGQFYKLLTGKNVAQINAYWARLLFSGRATPPRNFKDDKAIIQEVRTSPDSIAYVDRQSIDDTIKVIFEFQKNSKSPQ